MTLVLDCVEPGRKTKRTHATYIRGFDPANERHRLFLIQLGIINSLQYEVITNSEATNLLEDVRAKEGVLQIQLSENRIASSKDKINLAFSESFLLRIKLAYENLNVPRKRKLQSLMFPEGVDISNGGIGNHKIAPSFKLIKELAEGKNAHK